MQGSTYSGISCSLICYSKWGVQTANKKNDFLHKGIVAVGTDGYSCVIADGEVQPRFGNEQVLVAFNMDGKPLAASDGFALFDCAWRPKGERFVSNLIELQVVELAS